MKVMASTILVFRRMGRWNRFNAYHMGTAALGCPAEQSSAVRGRPAKPGRAALDWTAEGGCAHAVCDFLYSSLAKAASAVALPYSLSLLCKVFRLMARISAARVLLLLVASSVFRISSFSASSTVVPTPRRTVSESSAELRRLDCPNPGGRCLVSTTAPSHTIIARSRVLRISRTFPGQE